VASAESVQQGDPFGSLLFSLALNKLLRDNGAEFVSGYLDDIGLGDTVPRLVEQFRRLECAANNIGRQLNHDKCQILGLFAVSRPTWVRSVSTNMGSQCLDQHGFAVSRPTWVKSGFNFVVRPARRHPYLGLPSTHMALNLPSHTLRAAGERSAMLGYDGSA